MGPSGRLGDVWAGAVKRVGGSGCSLAMSETKRGVKSGHGMAVAGRVLGYIFVVPALSISTTVGIGSTLQGP
ncbi:hypothetical protein GCM10017673_36910 [Streptosporangium violaceochromogenes]|nr:hypothetical protein GCM10017673_36910 [Streptosporangium violaceochromogenes]